MVAPTTPVTQPKAKKWCLPKTGAEAEDLQRNIDYVCGLGVDCGSIQEGGSCFLPNTVRAHAAYAMNAYYQSTGKNDYDCDFLQTGAITIVDPSNCINWKIFFTYMIPHSFSPSTNFVSNWLFRLW